MQVAYLTLINDGPFPFPGGVELASGSEAFLPKGFSRIENKAESKAFRDTETDSLISAERASLPSFLIIFSVMFLPYVWKHFLIFKKIFSDLQQGFILLFHFYF